MARKKKIKENIKGVTLERYAAEGKSIGHLADGKTIMVTGGVPGDVVEIYLTKNKSQYAEGKVATIEQPSSDRIAPFCEHFGLCGGCKWQMLPYSQQLAYKQQQVIDQLTRLSKVSLPPIQEIIGSSQERYYRNKLEFTCSPLPYLSREMMSQDPVDDTPTVIGFHAPARYDKVVDILQCHLMDEPTNEIKNKLRSYLQEHQLTTYNARTQEGWMRNVIIRISTQGGVLVNVIVKEHNDDLEPLLTYLRDNIPSISTILFTINHKVNDTIYDLPVHTFSGDGYIEERLEDFTFRISPKSFFQTNTRQAERLYQVVRDFAALQGTEYIYDLYCGTGSIGIFLSRNVRKIVGIDTVADAIEDAKTNAALNGVANATFIAGDVIKIINDEFYERYGTPDIVITDPPRAGMHQDMIDKLLHMGVPTIVYVSCNPATQARDLQLLDVAYQVTRVQPVDMFPHTHHIECVVKLELRDN